MNDDSLLLRHKVLISGTGLNGNQCLQMRVGQFKAQQAEQWGDSAGGCREQGFNNYDGAFIMNGHEVKKFSIGF